jgi:hypothetical protein
LTPQLRAAFVEWARSRGHAAPPTEEGLRVLVAQFLGEAMRRGQLAQEPPQLIGADQAEHADHKINLLRDSGGMLDIADPETEDSDFGEFIRQRASAMEQSGGDDLAAHVIHRGVDTAKVTEQAPFARTQPPSITTAVLGGKATVTSGSLPVNLAYWQGDDAETTMSTVQVAPVNQLTSANSAFGDCSPFARVQFGTGGFLNTMEVDIGRGCMFSVPGSSIILDVGMDPVNIVGSTKGSMSLTGMITPGKQMYRSPSVVRSIFVDIQSGDTQFFSVPQFARSCIFEVFSNDASGTPILKSPPYLITFLSSGGSGYSRQFLGGTYWDIPIPLSTDIVQVSMKANGAFEVSGRLIFELSV